MKKLFVLTLFFVLFFLSACASRKDVPKNIPPQDYEPVACTLEAKICPDGSAVGRTGANCEFSPCPSEGTDLKTAIVKIYFGNTDFNPNAIECNKVFPVDRSVLASNNAPQLALQELFKGPSEEEKQAGYTSWFSEATKNILKSLKIENGTAYVNLQDIRQIIPNASSSCGSAEFLAEMKTTLKQFSSIKEVVFAIDEKPALFYEWLQIGCSASDSFCDEAPFKI
jgi:hypothetical protein